MHSASRAQSYPATLRAAGLPDAGSYDLGAIASWSPEQAKMLAKLLELSLGLRRPSSGGQWRGSPTALAP